MKNWFGSYKDAMRRTRWISVAAAVLVILQIAREFLAIQSNIISLEAPLSDGQMSFVVRDISLGILIGLSFVFRLWILGKRKETRSYLWIAGSWWFAATLSLIYVTRNSYLFEPQCNPEPDRICFGFYDIGRVDQIEVAASLFILSSVVRSVVTALVAIYLSRARLK